MVKKFLAVALGTSLGLVLFAGSYELFKQVQYYRWQSSFTSWGWFGSITVPSSNATLLWEYKPYATKEVVSTNRWGFRDRDYEVKTRPSGVRRYAFVGDSITLGMFVAEADVFVRQFEREAKLTSPGVQTLNFGIDGYNALQVVELVRARVLDFEPDEVVFIMGPNDFDFDDSWGYGLSGFKLLYFRKPTSFFADSLRHTLQKYFGPNYYHYHFERNQREVLESIVQLARELDSHGIGFHVAIVPVFDAAAKNFSTYPLNDVHAHVFDTLQSFGIHTLDLLPAFRLAEGQPRDFAFDEWHLNRRGHRLVARALLADLPH